MNDVDAFYNSLIKPDIDYFSESSFGKIRLYHGADSKYKILKPLGLDLGNTFTKPGWSVFAFKTYDEALNWAVYCSLGTTVNALREVDKTFKRETDNLPSHIAEFDARSGIAVVDQAIIPPLFKALKGRYFKSFVYTLDVDRKYVSIGNDSSINEYTIRSSVVPTKVDEYDIDETNFAEFYQVVSSYTMDKVLTNNKNAYGNRGFLSIFMNRDFVYHAYQSSNPTASKLYEAIRTKKLKPGDDILEFCEKYGINLAKVSFIDRLMMSHLIKSKLDVWGADV